MLVIRLLDAAHPELAFESTVISTEGDMDKTSPLTVIGGRGVFTSALQHRLVSGDIDLAVHAAKDVPSLSPTGVEIAAFPDREDPRDALISRHGQSLFELPASPVIGTSSRRRAAQIQALRPDAVIRELRGNIDTRLRKAMSDEYDAIVLAVAGVTRMGWADRITEVLAVEHFTPAPAQGAIAVEARSGTASDIAKLIDVSHVSEAVRFERRFLRAVGGGCTTPIGAYARRTASGLTLDAMLADESGTRLVREKLEFDADRTDIHDIHDRIDELATRMLRDTRTTWTSGKPVESEKIPMVLMTGSLSQIQPLQVELQYRGFATAHLETIRIEPPLRPVAEAGIGSADWVVITSPNAIPFVAGVVAGLKLGGARVAVVGRRTAAVAEAHGTDVDLVDHNGAESLANLMIALGVGGSSVVQFGSSLVRPVLADRLREAGANVEVIEAYRTVPLDSVEPADLELILNGGINAVTVASPSAVTSLRTLLGAGIVALSGASFVAIGETTAKALRQHELPVHEIATSPSAAAFADAVSRSVGAGMEVKP